MSLMLYKSDIEKKIVAASFLNKATKINYFHSYFSCLKQRTKNESIFKQNIFDNYLIK